MQNKKCTCVRLLCTAGISKKDTSLSAQGLSSTEDIDGADDIVPGQIEQTEGVSTGIQIPLVGIESPSTN